MSPAQSAAEQGQMALVRHTLAALAYRSAKALRGAPADFAAFRAREGSRTPIEILAHMGDLFDWSLGMADGKSEWRPSAPLPWDQEIARYFRALEAFDRRLASGLPTVIPLEQLFQGPIADALTHTGQIGMLRRMAGCPIRGENYVKAGIAAGQVGFEQPPPYFEFD